MAQTRTSAGGDWDRYKDEIESLYLTQGLTTEQVLTFMKEKYGFSKTTSQYKRQFKKWKFLKNSKDEIWKFIDHRIQKRRLEGIESDVFIHGKEWSPKRVRREIARHVPLSMTHRWISVEEAATPEGVAVCTPAPSTEVSLPMYVNLPIFEFEDLLQNKLRLPQNMTFGGLFNDDSTSPSRIVDISEVSTWWDPTFHYSSIIDTQALADTFVSGAMIGQSTFSHEETMFSPGGPALDQTMQSPQNMVSEDSLREARLLLETCLVGDVPPTRNGPDVHDIASRLEPFTVDRFPGELATNVKSIYNSNSQVAVFRLLAFCAYLSSNNLMSERETDGLVNWMSRSGHRWLIKHLSESASLTAKIFAANLLVSATRIGDIAMVKSLIRIGVNVNAARSGVHGTPALYEAVDRENMQLVELLLAEGADPNIERVDPFSPTPIRAACANENLELVKVLLKAGADPNPQGRGESMSSLWSSVSKRSPEIVDLLLKAGADPNTPMRHKDTITALQEAAGYGSPEIVQLLVESGADVNAPYRSMYETIIKEAEYDDEPESQDLKDWRDWEDFYLRLRPPMQLAAENNALECLQILLGAGAGPDLVIKDIDESLVRRVWDNDDTFTPLQAAVTYENVVMIRLLLGAGANIENRGMNDYGHTPLQVAAFAANVKMLWFLLQKGADINAPAAKYCGRTALQAVAGSGNLELAEILMEAGANVNGLPAIEQGRTALQAAAENGHLEMVQVLIEAGASVNAPPASVGGKTALQAAAGAEKNGLAMVKVLIKAKAIINAPAAREEGRTALQAAVESCDLAIVKLLLDSGADVNALANGDCQTAIQTAVKYGSAEITRLLLEYGANVSDERFGLDQMTALQIAASHGNVELTELLLTRHANVNAPASYHGKTALQAATSRGSSSMVRILLDAGADANAPAGCKEGRTALQYAVQRGELSLVKVLLERDADPNAIPTPAGGKKSLEIAMDSCPIDTQMVQTLLDAGADVNAFWESGWTAIQTACKKRKIQLVKLLLGYNADVNAPASSLGAGTMTAIEAAAETQDIDIVEMLIKAGADVNNPANPKNGKTALQAAVSNKCTAVVQVLIRNGAEVNAPPSAERGRTALQHAAQNGDVKMVEYLLNLGADVNAPAARTAGVTALQAASIGGYARIVHLLLQAGANANAAAALNEGRTAIEGAAEHGRLDVLHLLLDAHEENEEFELERRRAAKLAADNWHSAIAQFLNAYKKS